MTGMIITRLYPVTVIGCVETGGCELFVTVIKRSLKWLKVVFFIFVFSRIGWRSFMDLN